MNKLFALLVIVFLVISCNKKSKKTKILFVTSNINEMKSEPNGTYLIELAVPFNQFFKKGFEMDIVSPKGGEIPIYHSGDTTIVVKSIIQNEVFKNKTENSLKPSEINPEEYLAVVIPGGYGQFWDTHTNKDILQVISEIYDSGGIIGTIGHGTATLINVKLKSEEYLVKDKTMTSFPTWNEKNIMKQSDFGKLLPYDMETELQKRGANLKVYNHEKKINYEVVDSKNRLITASFSNSGEFVADEVLKLINKRE
ncbi:putative intracellular protease/amidase [Aquimarina sp. MAR_2010_214]|uniref:DJ-1/PfpI family protein n=1 Tax=Aquimarina sp. MAR_2010_214 TaxID=1250026 RepID=UPI000C7146BD|nr:DJ-1/PfpI family protein [Aquimarina sp. MAR_2010_214]PKV52837.1 putative intracellular protease/amidase [Aquimarina sp. MAR_2010_214]